MLRYRLRTSNKWGYLFIAPLIADFAFFTVYMVIRVSGMAFQEVSYNSTVWMGWDNFRTVLRIPTWWNAAKNTLVYTLGVVPVGILVALILAELIFRRSTRVQVFFKSTYYLPGVVSAIVMALVWKWIYQPYYGILNYFVSLFGMEPINWLMTRQTAMASLIFMAIIGGSGGRIVYITAAMGGIPTSLYDAAKIDGASEWTRFWRVTVPLLRPTLLWLFVTGFIGSFQVFSQIYVLTQGGPGYPGATETVGYHIYTAAFERLDFGMAAAESILLFIAILIFSLLQFRLFAADLEY
jgi:multiple sugar transport system permease protein